MDDNLISYTGDAEGRIWRNGVLLHDVPAPGSADWPRTAEERDLPAQLIAAREAGRTIADVLKFSGVRNLHVTVHGLVPGGTEDCVDVNNGCVNVDVLATGGYCPTGRYLSTIKGGSRHIHIMGRVLSRARVVEHDLGNWSDQSRHLTFDVTLDTAPGPGLSPVRYRVLNAERPHLEPVRTDYRCTFRLPAFLRPVFITLYGLLKAINPKT